MKTCINLTYRNLHQVKVMERMHIKHGDIDKQLDWVNKYSPKEQIYVCGNCESKGLCRFVNRYELRRKNEQIRR